MIRLEGIEKVYRTERIETVALANINLEVREGEFVSVMGPSGCGKSTLLNLIGLLDTPTSGKVHLDGTRIDSSQGRCLRISPCDPSMSPWSEVKTKMVSFSIPVSRSVARKSPTH